MASPSDHPASSPLVELSADEISFILNKLAMRPNDSSYNYSIPPARESDDCPMVRDFKSEYARVNNEKKLNWKKKLQKIGSCEQVKGNFCDANGIDESEVGEISCYQTPKGKRIILDLDMNARRRLDMGAGVLMVLYKGRWLPSFDYVNNQTLSMIEMILQHPNTHRYDGLINALKNEGFAAYDKLYIETPVRPRFFDKRVISVPVHIEGVPPEQSRCLIIDLKDPIVPPYHIAYHK